MFTPRAAAVRPSPTGAGRVIYTALGHPDDLWYQDWFRQHLTGCVRWALRLEA